MPSSTSSLRAALSPPPTTPSCRTSTCARATTRPSGPVAVRWARWTNTGCARSSLCPRPSGMARRRSIASRSAREQRSRPATAATAIPRQTRSAAWPRSPASHLHRSATGSRTGDSATVLGPAVERPAKASLTGTPLRRMSPAAVRRTWRGVWPPWLLRLPPRVPSSWQGPPLLPHALPPLLS
ncbi:sine oculis-related homeobox 5 homolog (Drosophila) (predicted) [Rattus norvegicus]|uniref:Sine oculis-related homeobox 5 homolog (Drosophila) (Predicted) n=1 Tax=Rattus norvegicus TaxID=10116 RepID=A6J8J7_RAT|nr:sine oculis-related homeobox 5 homolog (Drosophila) (predicted) [Rattus norvegicus]